MSLENAAAAFDADMGNTASPPVKEGKTVMAEPIFTNIGELEVDEDSPARGGGDDMVDPKPAVKKARQKDPDEFVGFDDDVDDDNPDDDEHPDDPDEEGDEEPDEEDEILSREFAVMVDGEEEKVTLRDALKNFSHRAAVDRRMNFVEQGRQAVVAEAQNVINLRQQVDQRLAEAAEILQALVPTEPNWDELFSKDPVSARNLQKQYEGFQSKIDEIKQKRAQNAQEARDSENANTVQFRNTEARKFAEFAKWDSAKSREKDLASMRRTALALGFSESEIGQVMDSRMLAVLLKASKYDRMMAAKPRPVGQTRQQKPNNPGAGRVRTAPKGTEKAMRNLQRTGSIEAAASVFEGLLNRS